MDYLTYNDYVVNPKNRWSTQQIDKKHKNRHNYRYNDINKKYWTKKNRISTKKLSKTVEYHYKGKIRKKTTAIITKNCFEVCVDIHVINDEENEEITLENSDYTLIKYKLKHMTINIFDTIKNVSYSSYRYRPCYQYDTSGVDAFDINSIYQTRDDIYIPLFFKDNIIQCQSQYIDINTPLFMLATKCWNLRNPSDLQTPQWTVSNIKYDNNTIDIELKGTIKIDDDNDALKFRKYRPLTKREMHALDIFDTINHQQLYCDYITENGHNIYYNLPIFIDKHKLSLKALFGDKFNVSTEQKMERKTKDKKYWFCHSCFTMNYMVSNENYECINCKKTFSILKNIYHEITSVNNVNYKTQIVSNIIKMVYDYKSADKSECIINETFTKAFINKYFQLKGKYLNNNNDKLYKPSIVYHWTRSEWFASINKIGLIVPDNKRAIHKTDRGFYGRGIYTSPNHLYAKCYGNSNKVFVCLCLPGKTYAAKYPQDLGVDLRKGYDSHYSSDRNQMEWVFFDTKQLLLLYLIDYKKINHAFIKHLNDIIQLIIGKKEIKKLMKINYSKYRHILPLTFVA